MSSFTCKSPSLGWDGCGILPDAVRGRTRAAAALAGLLFAAAPGCTAGPALYVGEADRADQADASVAGPPATGGQPAPSGDPVADAAGMDAGPTDATDAGSGFSVCGALNCGGATPYCDEVAVRCVACLEDAHCQGDLPRCFSTNVCVECVTNDDCGSNLCQIFEGHCLGFGF